MIPLFVTGHGAVTALGLDAPRTVASLRSGLDGLNEIPLTGVLEQDLRVVAVQGWAEGLVGARRFEALASRALAECMPALLAEERQSPALFLGLPAVAERPGTEPELETFLKAALEHRFNLPRGAVRTFAQGRTSIVAALKAADAWLRTGPQACIVGAVDTLLHPQTLGALSEKGLLAEEYDGFFPGEAAAFLCVSRRSMIGPWGRRAAAVIGLGEATETAAGTAEAPLVGVGLAAAMSRAVADAQIPPASIDWCLNAVNGGRGEFNDNGYALTRFLRTGPDQLETWHLASYLGETGAAFGALALLWASAAIELGLRQSSGALVSVSDGARRAAIVARPSGGAAAPHARAPQVGRAEPVLHGATPVGATDALADDPGIRFADEDDRHRALAVRDFDQLASMIFVRDAHLRSDSPWTDIESFELRALAHLDALAWSGNVARALIPQYLAGESEEAAAAAMVLCCAPARGDEVDLLLEACAQSDEHRARIAANVAVCPRTVGEPFLRRLAETGDSGLRDALWALTIAGWLTPEFLNDVARRTGRAFPELVTAFGVVQGPPGAAPPAAWLTSGGAPLPTEAALAGMVIESPRAWLDSFRVADLVEVMPEAFGIGALALKRSVLQALGPTPAPTRGAIIAIGWSGEVDGTPLLLDGLRVEDEDVAIEAARALRRIYGVSPIETVEVPDDAAAGEQEPEATEAASETDDAPASDEEPDDDEKAEPPPPRQADRLSRNPVQWQEIIKTIPLPSAGGKASGPRRFRSGRAWHSASALEMLVDPKMPCTERMVAIWEHAIVTRRPLAVHPRQWVATQRRLLAAAPTQ